MSKPETNKKAPRPCYPLPYGRAAYRKSYYYLAPFRQDSVERYVDRRFIDEGPSPGWDDTVRAYEEDR